MDSTQTTDIDPRIELAKELRHALSAFATGVTVVTTQTLDGQRHGLTANSFSSVSLDPPMVLWSQSVKAPSHPYFLEASHFAVNVLAEDQVELSNRFSRRGVDKFADLSVTTGLGNSPLLLGCAATFECSSVYRYPGGDHTIFVGKVERFTRAMKRPLIFAAGKYMAGVALELPDGVTDPGSDDLGDVRAVRYASAEVIALARELQETIGIGVWGNHGPTMLRWEQGGLPISPSLRSGLVLPVLTSATGLLLAAYLSPASTCELMQAEADTDPVARITHESTPEILEEIRARGFASMRSSAFPDMYGGDVDAISAPVHNARGEVVLAITAVKRSDDLRDGWQVKVGSQLQTAAIRVSKMLGYKT